MMPEEQKKTKKRIQPPHPFVVIFLAMLCAAALTYLVPLGRYELQESAYAADSRQPGSAAVDPDSFRYVADENNERVTYPVPVFGLTSNNEQGVMNFLFSGLADGRRATGAAGLIAYLLVIGGSFGVLRRTGVVDQIILVLARSAEGVSALLPPGLFILFSLLGAAFGFSEAAIPLSMLLIPLLIAMDFDAVTGVLVTFAAMQLGMAFSWMSPAALASAQTLAGLAAFSGARLRLLLWVVFTVLGAAYTAIYALRVRDDPRRSAAQASDARCRGRLESVRRRREAFTTGGLVVLLLSGLALFWLFWGILTAGYGLAEIASLFFILALASGLVGAVFHLDGMRFSDIPRAFQAGAGELLGAVLVVGMTQGMVQLLGGISPTNASVLNTLLHWTERAFRELHGLAAALLMYVFQFGFQFIVPSDTGQAALTMPILAPLTDALGISRQISVLAFQLGGSLSPLLAPTSGCLIGVLSVAHLEWADWLRSQWRALLLVFVLAAGVVMLATGIGYT